MPYLFTTVYYPSSVAQKVAERHFEVHQKFPQDDCLGEEVVPVATRHGRKGVEAIGILDIKEGKLEEARNRAAEMCAACHDIEGFEYSIRIYSNLAEAMASTGISLPEGVEAPG